MTTAENISCSVPGCVRNSPIPDQGPDQIIEADSYVTSVVDGVVKLRLESDKECDKSAEESDHKDHVNVASKYPPISLPTMLIDAADKSPSHPALGVKRDDKWVKWTYSEYLEGMHISFCWI